MTTSIAEEERKATITAFDEAWKKWKIAEVVRPNMAGGLTISCTEIARILNERAIESVIKCTSNEVVAEFVFDARAVELRAALDGSGFISVCALYKIPSDFSLGELLPRCNRLNRKLRCVKAQCIVEESLVAIAVEFIAYNSAHIGEAIEPAVSSILGAADSLFC